MVEKAVDARARLQEAALALFGTQGFDRTTAAEIAARAGVTERTFFRHFPDKKEVLFDGEAFLGALLTEAVAETPARTGALDTLLGAIRTLEPVMRERRSYMVARTKIIGATPALRERELAKISTLMDVMTSALTLRGVPGRRAALASRIAMTAFTYVTFEWLDDPREGLAARLQSIAWDLEELIAESCFAAERPLPHLPNR